MNGLTPVGGQHAPISIPGARLVWKKAQKKETKKKTSLTINKSIPQRRPNSTTEVWRPCMVPSLLISRHHCNIVSKIILNPKNIRLIEFKWNHLIKPEVRKKAPVELIKGHGDSSTMW